MTIYLGADHGGYQLKEKIKDWLSEWGYQYEDKGNQVLDPADDFPDYAALVAQTVSEDPVHALGILICRSGAGVEIVANKYPRVLASLLFSPQQARAAKKDDKVNIAALAADYISEQVACEIVKTWLETPFEAETERRMRRLKKIEDIEKKTMK